MTLFCGSGGFSAQATSVAYWWNLPNNPLSGSGTYRMDLINSGFASAIKVWPAPCFLKLTQYGDNNVQAQGKQFSVISQEGQSSTYTASLSSSTNAANAVTSAGSTSSATTSNNVSTTSNALTASSPPSTSSSQTSNPSASTNLPTSASSQNSGLSTGAKAGIAVGAILAVIIIALLSWIIILLRRKRRIPHGYDGEVASSRVQEPELSAINHTNSVYYDQSHRPPASGQYRDKYTSQPQEIGPGALRRELP